MAASRPAYGPTKLPEFVPDRAAILYGLRHLEEEYGYEIVDDGARAALRPGEVVSNG